MKSTPGSFDKRAASAAQDGFEVLDACHRQTLSMLSKFGDLVSGVESGGPDAQTRAMAAEVVEFFSTTARQHHEDEERHIFPKLVAGGEPETVQAVLRLQQDHGWLEEDWLELSAHLDALADGESWYDLAVLREGVDVITALYYDHIALEEAYIYPQARARLQAGERREMGREMAARRRAERKSRAGSDGG